MRKYLGSNKLLIGLSLLFLVISLSFILPNGDLVCKDSLCQLSIGDWHMHDALWHISLAKLGFGSWPLTNPFMSGSTLSGYNFLLDYIMYLMMKVGLSPFTSFFKVLPIIAAITYVYSVISYLKFKKMPKVKANIYAFFLYFASSFSYLATLYADGKFTGSTLRGFPVISSITPVTMFLNIQFAFSLSIILWILMISQSNMKFLRSLLLGFLYFLLFGFKFYGAIVALVMYGLFSLWTVANTGITKQKIFEIISVGIFSLLGLYVFYGLGTGSQFPFVYAPFALPHLFIDDPLLFYNHSLTLARYFLYEKKTGFSPRLVGIEVLSIFLFIIFNFGTRILSNIYIISSIIRKNLIFEHLVFFIITIVTFLIPIFFVQSGGWYNTMQFLYYGLWFASFLTAEYCYQLYTSKSKIKHIFLLIMFLLTIPNIIDQLRYINAPQITISSNELKALEVLKAAPPGIVHINDPVHRNGYVSALAEKIPYYLDTDQLMVTHTEHQDRLDFINTYKGGSITTVPADYFYIYKTEWGTQDAIQALSNPGFKIIYESDEINIYERIKTRE
jgi:hypothetical protein